ncbi:hypothetical protein HMPREF0322_00699 [Desulfitobacterium hafniense DP7]|uniref:Uncharacterized protein n=1 Tax=Desulfitobacterium hafniense DP7 TaxID=537010 RepID=G9XIC3_DESHA|nr:hypothetical protein HMPREF0322_00699 [Desulfitobacterium hafniense DP7]
MMNTDRSPPGGGAVRAKVAKIRGYGNPVKIEPVPFYSPGAVIIEADAPFPYRIIMLLFAGHHAGFAAAAVFVVNKESVCFTHGY